MSSLKEIKSRQKGYQLHLIPTEKFKTVHFVIKFKTILQPETVTARALLPYVLRQGMKYYPSEQALQRKIDELYGATLSLDIAKKGDYHVFSIRVAIANEKFIPNESTLVDETLQLLHEVIFQPLTEGSGFKTSIVEREKQTLQKKIESIVDHKIQYANLRLIDEMFAEENYRLRVHGYVDDLKTLSAEKLYQQYKHMLNEDQIDFYVLGDFNLDKLKEKVTSVFTFETNNYEPAQTNMNKKHRVAEVKNIVETEDIQQAKLHIGYRTYCTYSDELYPAMQVFNGLFGGFPISKLFMNVREKHSLAYYASSQLDSHKVVLFVFSGIDHKNNEKTQEIINDQMKAMKSGKFSEESIEETKKMLINQILETLDHPQGIIEMFYQQVIANYERSPNQFIQQIKLVTKEEVIDISKQVTQDTIYLLTEKSGDQ